jgi:hypothetical protein
MVASARCQGITTAGAPCRGRATRFGYCPVHAPALAPVMREAKRKGGYNKAHTRRLRRLLEESGLAPVFEGALRLLARLEGGELSPQVALAASHLLKIALETVATAHKLSRGEGAPPQVLPPVTAVTQDEERWARVMARAAQICEEATAAETPLVLDEKEEREAQLIAQATRELERVWPSQLRQPPSALPAEAPHAPTVGVRTVFHGRP